MTCDGGLEFDAEVSLDGSLSTDGDLSPDALALDASIEAEILDAEIEEPDAEIETVPPLIIIRRYDGERFELTPENDDGGFDDEDLAMARLAWQRHKGVETHEIHPRLLNMIYKAARHFKAPHVLLTSGYRPGRITSYHAHGRALDFHLPKVGCRKLADHLRSYGFVGVGVYPRTGGVHLDVRDRSYFWISYAPKGVRWRERGILQGLAKEMDARARERGLEPPEPLPKAARAARARVARRRKGRKAPQKRRAPQKKKRSGKKR